MEWVSFIGRKTAGGKIVLFSSRDGASAKTKTTKKLRFFVGSSCFSVEKTQVPGYVSDTHSCVVAGGRRVKDYSHLFTRAFLPGSRESHRNSTLGRRNLSSSLYGNGFNSDSNSYQTRSAGSSVDGNYWVVTPLSYAYFSIRLYIDYTNRSIWKEKSKKVRSLLFSSGIITTIFLNFMRSICYIEETWPWTKKTAFWSSTKEEIFGGPIFT